MSDSGPVIWLKRGILGCGGLLALLFVAVVVGGGVLFLQGSQGADRTEEMHSQAVPPSDSAPGRTPATAEQLADASSQRSLDLEDVAMPPTPQGAGVVDLDLAMGFFTIVPSDGPEIEVVADYDKSRYRLRETFTQEENGEWRYKIRFRRRGLFSFEFNADDNRLEIRIPRSVPVSLEGEVRMGKSELELGGLWLRRFELETAMGEHTVSFSEPTAAPMDHFEIEGQMGALRLEGIGNASPKRFEAAHRMGEMRADLSGDWRNDSSMKLRFQMGELGITGPQSAHVEVTRSRVLMGAKNLDSSKDSELPDGAPTLYLDVSGSMGEVRLR